MSAKSGFSVSPKSGVTTLLLCLFLGSLGVHRFYVGKVKTGLLMLVTAGGLGIWTLVDLVMIACCEFTDSEGRTVMFSRTGDSPLKLVLAIIALCLSVLLIYVAIVGAAVYYLTTGITDTVQYQLAAIREGDLEKAYSYTSPDFRRATSFDTFKEFVEQVPALKYNESASFPSRAINNNEGVISGTIRSQDGSAASIEYLLVNEDKQWKIQGIRVNPDDSGALDNDQSSASESSSAKEDASKKVENLTYTDPSGEYTISYPDNWYFDQTDKSSVMFSGKKGSPSYYATVTIQALPMKKKGGIYGTVKDIVDDLKGQINEKTTNVNFISEGKAELPVNVKGYKGQYFIVTYTYKGEDMKKMQFIIIRPDGNAAYSWGYTTPVDLYDKDLPIAKSMYESWTIK